MTAALLARGLTTLQFQAALDGGLAGAGGDTGGDDAVARGEFGFQPGEGLAQVKVARTRFGGGHHDPGRQMRQAYSGLALVAVLTAGAGGPEEVDAQFMFVQWHDTISRTTRVDSTKVEESRAPVKAH